MPYNHITSRMMKKNLEFIKYISPSSKEWAGILSLMSRDVLTSIGRENIDNISLADRTCLPNHLYNLKERLTKFPPVISMFRAFIKEPT